MQVNIWKEKNELLSERNQISYTDDTGMNGWKKWMWMKGNELLNEINKISYTDDTCMNGWKTQRIYSWTLNLEYHKRINTTTH